MLDWLANFIDHNPYASKILGSIGVVIVALLIRFVLRRSIRIAQIPSIELRRRWILQIRTLTLLGIILGVAMIWATELHTMALSLVAIIVGLVIATKELIACFTGSMLKLGSRAFTLGDRIRVGEYAGDVIDQTLLSTTLMEVGPGHARQYTGRVIVVPNSLLLVGPVAREASFDDYAIVTLTVPLARGSDLATAERVLLDACHAACASYLDQVKRVAERLKRTEGIDPPTIDPLATVVTVDEKRFDLLLRFPTPIEGRRDIEQKILRAYLEHEHANKAEGG